MLLWIILLALAGSLLIFSEVFVPGMILGFIGGCAMVAAVLLGYFHYGFIGGSVAALAVMVLSGVAVGLGLQFFPKSAAGKILTLRGSLDGAVSHAPQAALMGLRGTALTTLRPSGMAQIEGRRVDVMAESDMIEEGSQIEVIAVEGSKVVVRRPS